MPYPSNYNSGCHAEFYFTETLWPDFDKEELLLAIQKLSTKRASFRKDQRTTTNEPWGLLRPITLMLLLLPPEHMSSNQPRKDTTAMILPMEIAGIRVEGIETLDERSLVAHSGLFVGQMINVPGDETSRAIQNSLKLRLFSNIQPKQKRSWAIRSFWSFS